MLAPARSAQQPQVQTPFPRQPAAVRDRPDEAEQQHDRQSLASRTRAGGPLAVGYGVDVGRPTTRAGVSSVTDVSQTLHYVNSS